MTYWQGGAAPLAQTTVEPGGTTTVVFCLGGGGSLLLKLKQPPRDKGSNKSVRRKTRMRSFLTMRWDTATGAAALQSILGSGRTNKVQSCVLTACRNSASGSGRYYDRSFKSR